MSSRGNAGDLDPVLQTQSTDNELRYQFRIHSIESKKPTMVTAADEYLESRVLTAPPEKLHLMVVEAALRFARQGQQALAHHDHASACDILGRSRACITELIASIRADENPELADRLRALFLFCHRRLLQADLEHNGRYVDDAIGILESHRETWLELLARLPQDRIAVGAGARVESYDEMSTQSWSS